MRRYSIVSAALFLILLVALNALRLQTKMIKRVIGGAFVTLGVSTFQPLLMPTQNNLGYNPNFVAVAADVKTNSIFDGSYKDPNHPGCLRKISSIGKVVTILGSDNLDGSQPFKIMAKEVICLDIVTT